MAKIYHGYITFLLRYISLSTPTRANSGCRQFIMSTGPAAYPAQTGRCPQRPAITYMAYLTNELFFISRWGQLSFLSDHFFKNGRGRYLAEFIR